MYYFNSSENYDKLRPYLLHHVFLPEQNVSTFDFLQTFSNFLIKVH